MQSTEAGNVLVGLIEFSINREFVYSDCVESDDLRSISDLTESERELIYEYLYMEGDEVLWLIDNSIDGVQVIRDVGIGELSYYTFVYLTAENETFRKLKFHE